MPSVWERTRAAYSAFKAPGMISEYGENHVLDLPRTRREYCQLLDFYYTGRVYKEMQVALSRLDRGPDFTKIRALENPAIQAVNFHVMHLFPGPLKEAMPIVAEGSKADALKKAAENILLNGNMGRKKKLFTNYQARHGEVFLQATSTPKGFPYPKVMESKVVTEFEEDSRGYITYIRLDIYTNEDKNNPWLTQEWDKETQLFRQWRTKEGPLEEIDKLGTPEEENRFVEFGIDFVPFVRAPFEEGEYRGIGVFERFLDPIDEENRQATTVRDRYFRYGKVTHLTRRNEPGKGATDVKVNEKKDERPAPGDKEIITQSKIDEEQWLNLPGNSSHEFLIPNIDWQAGLNMLEDTRTGLENQMPELRYFRGHDSGDPSAAAMRTHIGPAIQRAEEAKGNAETALIQVTQMCLTIGAHTGAMKQFGRGGVGSFDSGDYQLSFAKRDILPESPQERAAREQADAAALGAYKGLSTKLFVDALIARGYSEDDAKRIAGQPTETSPEDDDAISEARRRLEELDGQDTPTA